MRKKWKRQSAASLPKCDQGEAPKLPHDNVAQEVSVDPKIDKVSFEDIGLKHAARFAIDIDFTLGRDITTWQDGIITNLVINLENVTKDMEYLERIELAFNLKVSDQAEDQLHRILSTLLRVQPKNLFSLWFNMKISFEDQDDANNQPMSFETLPHQ